MLSPRRNSRSVSGRWEDGSCREGREQGEERSLELSILCGWRRPGALDGGERVLEKEPTIRAVAGVTQGLMGALLAAEIGADGDDGDIEGVGGEEGAILTFEVC
jgi:hypothetical protein